MDHSWVHLRRSLFQKYFLALFVAVVVPLLVSGISDAWFGYRDQRAMLDAVLRTQAASAAARIDSFLQSIRNQLGWTVQQTWAIGTEEQHRLDALRVLRQIPAVVSVTLVDGEGLEQVYVSRIDLNRFGSRIDRSREPRVSATYTAHIWYGPVTFYHQSEPYQMYAV